MLHKGDFGIYLARLGRMDLVRAAKEAQAQADPDIALQNFLSNLPGRQPQGGRASTSARAASCSGPCTRRPAPGPHYDQ